MIMGPKIENRKIEKLKSGFTLLVAIVVTSMLLLVSFVVVNVALKQLVLANSSQESQYAFYNSDSGMECAIYWDLKNSSGPSAFSTTTPSTISCNNNSLLVGGPANDPSSVFSLNLEKGRSIVTVTKASNGLTTIDSRGYNTCDNSVSRRFERGITVTY